MLGKTCTIWYSGCSLLSNPPTPTLPPKNGVNTAEVLSTIIYRLPRRQKLRALPGPFFNLYVGVVGSAGAVNHLYPVCRKRQANFCGLADFDGL